jgi:hypothetical protein
MMLCGRPSHADGSQLALPSAIDVGGGVTGAVLRLVTARHTADDLVGQTTDLGPEAVGQIWAGPYDPDVGPSRGVAMGEPIKWGLA